MKHFVESYSADLKQKSRSNNLYFDSTFIDSSSAVLKIKYRSNDSTFCLNSYATFIELNSSVLKIGLNPWPNNLNFDSTFIDSNSAQDWAESVGEQLNFCCNTHFTTIECVKLDENVFILFQPSC